MAEKSDSNIDLDEIRRMIGGDKEASDQEFSLEDIISGVKDEQKKLKIERKKKEEEENPFLSLVRETEELDASVDSKEELSESREKYLRQPPARSFPQMAAGSVQRPKPETINVEEKIREKEEISKSSEKTKTPKIDETVSKPQVSAPFDDPFFDQNKEDEQVNTGRTAGKILPLDFDETEFNTPEEAVRYYKKREASLNVRAFFTLLFALCGTYLTLAPTLAFPLPLNFSYAGTPYLYLFALIALEVGCMLIALDLTSAGMMRLFLGRPTIYSLTALSALATLSHSISIIVFPKWGGYLPFSSLSCVLIFFMLLSAAQKKSSLWRSIKAETLSSEPMIIKTEKEAMSKPCVFRSSDRNSKEYEKTLLLPDPLEHLGTFYVPCAIIASLTFATVATFGQKRPELFLWAFSGIITVSLPWGLLIAYSAPAKAIAKKMLSFGAGVAGFFAAKELLNCRSVVLTDTDLFPPKTVQTNGMKIFPPYTKEKVLKYTGSIIIQSEMGLRQVFSELMQEQYITPSAVSELQFFESGGIAGTINEDHVLVGTPTFLLRMGR